MWNKMTLPPIPLNDYAKSMLWFSIGRKKMEAAGFTKDKSCQLSVRFDEEIPQLDLSTSGFVLDGIMYFETQCQKAGSDDFSEVVTFASSDLHLTGLVSSGR